MWFHFDSSFPMFLSYNRLSRDQGSEMEHMILGLFDVGQLWTSRVLGSGSLTGVWVVAFVLSGSKSEGSSQSVAL